jgi:hypothetical protein
MRSLLIMNKIDARKISRDALKALRGQAMRLRQELSLPWREIARVMGLNVTIVFGWAQRYAAESKAGLTSKKPGRAYPQVSRCTATVSRLSPCSAATVLLGLPLCSSSKMRVRCLARQSLPRSTMWASC